MDLGQAMRIVGSRAVFLGQSDAAVAALAQAGLQHAVARPVPRLNGWAVLRPVDILLHLAYATRLNYERTVLDVYMQWALSRYIGAFDLATIRRTRWNGLRRLELSDAGRRVAANQRRVFSEDVGIGLASLLALRVFGAAHPGLDIHLVDIDVAIASGVIAAPPGSRADYLVVAEDAGTGRLLLLGIVEAKGSESRANAFRQVKRGAEQLESTMVRGRSVPGLVCVAQSGRDGMMYYTALVAPSGTSGAIDLGAVTGRRRTVFDTSWAKIADFADRPELYDLVAPKRLKDKRPPGGTRSDARKARQVVAGLTYEGTEAVVPLPGGDLHVFLGAETRIVEALQEGSFERAAGVRASLRGLVGENALLETPEPTGGGPVDRVESASEDGVALVLRAYG